MERRQFLPGELLDLPKEEWAISTTEVEVGETFWLPRDSVPVSIGRGTYDGGWMITYAVRIQKYQPPAEQVDLVWRPTPRDRPAQPDSPRRRWFGRSK